MAARVFISLALRDGVEVKAGTLASTGTYEWNIEIWSGQKSPSQKNNAPKDIRILKVERHDLMAANWYQLNNDNLSSLEKLVKPIGHYFERVSY